MSPSEPLTSRVLVGVDGSPNADEAVAFATYLTDALGGSVQTATVPSPAAGELAALAARESATLLVLGASHVGQLGRVLPGSTPERVMTNVHCPVVVVPADWHRSFESVPRTVAVATNGSRESRAAVAQAAAIARAWPAQLVALAVCPYGGGYASVGSPGAAAAVAAGTELGLQEELDRTVDELEPDLPARPVLLRGDPAHALAERSAGLALLVVGSRGYGPLRAAAFGAVSGRVMRDARCPVMVVPRVSAAGGSGAPSRAAARLP